MIDDLIHILERELPPDQSMHSWRCSYPERYGIDCDCAKLLADTILEDLQKAGWNFVRTYSGTVRDLKPAYYSGDDPNFVGTEKLNGS